MSTNTLKLAIIGAGNAGVTMAAHAKLAGAPKVSLYDRHDHELSIIADNNNQIKLEGKISPQGIATIDLLTTDPAELARDSNFYICDTPAFSHAAVVETFAPYLNDGDVFMFHPGRTGAVLEAREILKKLSISKKITLLESQTLLYACRINGATATAYGVKNTVSVAGEDTQLVHAAIDLLSQYIGSGSWSVEKSVLQTSLENIGMLFHPAITLTNLARLESAEPFYFYTEGASRAVANLILGLDLEKERVALAYGVKVDTVLQWMEKSYSHSASTIHKALADNPAYQAVKAPMNLSAKQIRNFRYLAEDVPYGLVPFSALGAKAGIQTPYMDSVIAMASQVALQDFRKSGRSLDCLGLADKTVEEIASI